MGLLGGGCAVHFAGHGCYCLVGGFDFVQALAVRFKWSKSEKEIVIGRNSLALCDKYLKCRGNLI